MLASGYHSLPDVGYLAACCGVRHLENSHTVGIRRFNIKFVNSIVLCYQKAIKICPRVKTVFKTLLFHLAIGPVFLCAPYDFAQD